MTNPALQQAEQPSQTKASSSSASSRGRSDPALMLARLWQQKLPLVQERIVSLESAAQQAQDGALLSSVRQEAASTAHKLAGSLGMFGFPQGTEIARELEVLLEAEDQPHPARLLQLATDLRAALSL